MGLMQDKVEAALRDHIDPGDPPQLCDYGTIQGGSAGRTAAKAAFWRVFTGSSTAEHKAHDYVAIAVTARSVIVVDVKFAAGLTGMKLKPKKGRAARVFPREHVGIAVGAITQRRGQTSVPVQLTFADGTTELLELYDNAAAWRHLATR